MSEDGKTKGQSMTGMVHLAYRNKRGQLVQRCGISRRQGYTLGSVPSDTKVTCKKCAALESSDWPVRVP